MFRNIWKNIFNLKNSKTELFSETEAGLHPVIPNFFIVGAPKCGTTALSEYLREHPNVFMCSPKEPKYFDFDFNYPIEWTEKSYLNLYSKADPKRHHAIGEASVTYHYSECAISRILKLNPESKFIIMLRNPVDLVRSWHAQEIFTGQENISDFEKGLARRRGEEAGTRCSVCLP